MNTDTSHPAWGIQEALLHEALLAHAPAVDTDAGWQAIASRIVAASQSAPADSGRAGRRARQVVTHLLMPQRRFALVASLVAAVVLLCGAGVGAAYWGGFLGGAKAQLIGDASLYTTVDQSQTVGNISLAIAVAYADPGNTYLAVTIRMPRDLAQRYSNAALNHVTITDTSGAEAYGLLDECSSLTTGLFSDVGVEHCMLDVSPFVPAPGTTHLALTVDIGEVWLLRPGSASPDVRSGPWHFHFTIPFHAKTLGPGGPYTQSTPGS